jgi:hypothetical protein
MILGAVPHGCELRDLQSPRSEIIGMFLRAHSIRIRTKSLFVILHGLVNLIILPALSNQIAQTAFTFCIAWSLLAGREVTWLLLVAILMLIAFGRACLAIAAIAP